MKIGIYAGSFDPITNGHLNVIERASRLFDKLIVAVLKNVNKKQGLLTIEERKQLIEASTTHLKNIEVDFFSGLLVEYANLKEAHYLVRGIRSYNDLDSEQTLAHLNQKLNPDIETIFFMTDEKYRTVSSSAVRELVHFNGDYKWMVPDVVYTRLNNMR